MLKLGSIVRIKDNILMDSTNADVVQARGKLGEVVYMGKDGEIEVVTKDGSYALTIDEVEEIK